MADSSSVLGWCNPGAEEGRSRRPFESILAPLRLVLFSLQAVFLPFFIRSLFAVFLPHRVFDYLTIRSHCFHPCRSGLGQRRRSYCRLFYKAEPAANTPGLPCLAPCARALSMSRSLPAKYFPDRARQCSAGVRATDVRCRSAKC